MLSLPPSERWAMAKTFTPEEQELFGTLLQRAITNMGGTPSRRKNKEDNNQ